MVGKKDSSNASIGTLIGKGTSFLGNFSTVDGARIDGAIDGNVVTKGVLVVGAEGIITGNIESKSVMIGGTVFGNIVVEDKVVLTATAKVIGDISTAIIVIDEHAIFQGNCDMKQDGSETKKNRIAIRDSKNSRKSAKLALQEALREAQENEKSVEIQELHMDEEQTE